MSLTKKLELQELAKELQAKLGHLMTPASNDVCDVIFDDSSWQWNYGQPTLYDDEYAGRLRQIHNLYFSELLVA